MRKRRLAAGGEGRNCAWDGSIRFISFWLWLIWNLSDSSLNIPGVGASVQELECRGLDTGKGLLSTQRGKDFVLQLGLSVDYTHLCCGEYFIDYTRNRLDTFV